MQRRNADGSETVYAASATDGKMPQGERRVMDCIDCHNRAAHTMQTAEDALNRAMAEGAISPELPLVHKKALELLKAEYATEAEARQKIPAQLEAFYRSEHPDVMATKANVVKAAGEALVQHLHPQCVSGYEGDLGNASQPHRAHELPGLLPLPRWRPHRAGRQAAITQDCAACHNLLAVDEKKPKVLSDLGIVTPVVP